MMTKALFAVNITFMVLFAFSCQNKTMLSPEAAIDFEMEYVKTKNEATIYSYDGKALRKLEANISLPIGEKLLKEKDEYMYTSDDYLCEESFLVKISDLNIPRFKSSDHIEYLVKGSMPYRVINNKYFPIKGVNLVYDQTVADIECHFIFSDEIVAKMPFEKAGTYFFDHKGKLVSIFPFGSIAESSGVYISENGKYIGIDAGTWSIRSLGLYTFPAGEKMEALHIKVSSFGGMTQ